MMCRHSIVRYLFFIFLYVILIVGCGGPKQLIKKESSRPTAPDWVNRLPQSEEYLYFVGTSSRAVSLKEGKEQGRTDAAKQAANYIGVTLKSEFQMQASTELESTLVNEKIKTQTEAYIASLEIVDEYYIRTMRQAGRLYEEHYDIYLLCRLPKKAGQEERDRQKKMAQEKASIAFALYQEAEKDFTDHNFAESLYKLREAQKNLQGVSEVISINSTNLKTNQELTTAINLRLGRLENKSRSLYTDITIAGEKEHKNCGLFIGSFSKEASRHKLNIVEQESASRFKLSININHRKGGIVFGRQCVYAIYNFKIKDTWTNKTITGDSGEAKGFAPTIDDAAQNSVIEVASTVGIKISSKIEKYLQQSSYY